MPGTKASDKLSVREIDECSSDLRVCYVPVPMLKRARTDLCWPSCYHTSPLSPVRSDRQHSCLFHCRLSAKVYQSKTVILQSRRIWPRSTVASLGSRLLTGSAAESCIVVAFINFALDSSADKANCQQSLLFVALPPRSIQSVVSIDCIGGPVSWQRVSIMAVEKLTVEVGCSCRMQMMKHRIVDTSSSTAFLKDPFYQLATPRRRRRK